MEDAITRLTNHDIRPSMQRMAVMDYLMKHRTHPTVDEIYVALAKKMPTLSRTTVYNVLKVLTEAGAAQTLTIDERNTCYDADTSIHGHFLCTKCHRVYDVPSDGACKKVEDMDMDGHEVHEVHYYYKGICRDCRAEEHAGE